MASKGNGTDAAAAAALSDAENRSERGRGIESGPPYRSF